MFWSVFTISLSLFTLVSYISIQIYSQYSDNYFKRGYSLNFATCLGYLLEVLIFIAISLDLYKWSIFLATTKTDQTYHFEEIMNKKRKRQFCVLISVLILVGSIFTSLFIAILATTYDGIDLDEPNEILKVVTKSLISLILSIFLITYIFTLSILISHLKNKYRSFYLQQRCKILTCAISLIITLSAKIFLRMLEYNTAFSDWLYYG